MNYEQWLELISMHLSNAEFVLIKNKAENSNKYIGLKPEYDSIDIDYYSIEMLTLVDSLAFLEF